MIKKLFILIFIVSFVGLNTIGVAYAGFDVEIEGNGDASQNSVNVNIENTSQVEQSNVEEISQNITVDANSGNNTANENTGNASITTGEVGATVVVVNQGNTNSASDGCCKENDVNADVLANGSASQNNSTINLVSENVVLQNNYSSVINNINIKANTGENIAANNMAEVKITTGNIVLKSNIVNVLNSNLLHLSEFEPSVVSSVKNNGTGSVNNSTYSHKKLNIIGNTNNSFILNNLNFLVNTGKNTALGNAGNVSIDTGKIFVDIQIKNSANTNTVTLQCEPTQAPTPTPAPVTPTITPPVGGPCQSNCGDPGNSSPSSSSSSSSNDPRTVVGAGQVLGLSKTGSGSIIDGLIYIISFICLLKGVDECKKTKALSISHLVSYFLSSLKQELHVWDQGVLAVLRLSL